MALKLILLSRFSYPEAARSLAVSGSLRFPPQRFIKLTTFSRTVNYFRRNFFGVGTKSLQSFSHETLMPRDPS